ncbi:histone-lysine N-methyltransferase SETD1B [Neocloeon triangulifer]|uniref:histone-lysine N-methyltransferase SETD1B n=1 Tax=Neocloeon triangulifer TaxID=2078957 RepID=UPI00286F72C6|nr:histone-lysine N-methyltransferase SETD1B [Neocloeon triangulifer]
MATEEPSIVEQCDEVTESLELLDAVLLQFDEEKRTPPPPEEAARIISSLVGSPYQSLQRGQGTQTTLPRPNKKLSSQFGSLPFDLSAHAAPSAPPWLSKEAPRNHLYLPIQNPLTVSIGHSSEEEQFSDDSLEGQVWSSDRDLSNDRDDLASRGDIVSEGEKHSKDDGRVSIAWKIDWNDKRNEQEIEMNGKGTYVIKEKKRRSGLEEGLFDRPQMPSSKSSDHLDKSANISRGRSLPSLNCDKPLENGFVVAINQDDERPVARVNGFKYIPVELGENSLDACDSLSADVKAVDEFGDNEQQSDGQKCAIVNENSVEEAELPADSAAIEQTEDKKVNGAENLEEILEDEKSQTVQAPEEKPEAEILKQEPAEVIELFDCAEKEETIVAKVILIEEDKVQKEEDANMLEDNSSVIIIDTKEETAEEIVETLGVQKEEAEEAPPLTEETEVIIGSREEEEIEVSEDKIEGKISKEEEALVLDTQPEQKAVEEMDLTVAEKAPEEKSNAEEQEEIQASPIWQPLDSGSEVSEDETKTETPRPCELSFKIMRPKVIPRPNSLPTAEESVVVYTNSVILYPDAGLITYYDERSPPKESPKEGPNLLRPKSCSDISSTAAFACVDISIDDEPLSLEPITITATEDASETIDAEDETEELDEEIKEEMKERVMELPVKVDCLVQTEISGLGRRLCLGSPGEQVVPSMAGFTPVENKSLELSLATVKKESEELPAIQRPAFFEPLLSRENRRRPHHGSQGEVNIPQHRHSVPESFLFPNSFTIPLSFAVTNKPSPGNSDVEEASVEIFKEKRKELPPPPLPEHQNVPKSIENRPRQKTPVEPEYRSVHKTRPPPPLPPHQNLTELYSEPRSFPDAFPAPPPPPLAPSYSDHKAPAVPDHKSPAVPEHKAPAVPNHKVVGKAPAVPEHRASYPEQPLPPTPLTPDRPLPPSPRLPTSASFPVPPVARHSPNIPHRPLPSPPNTLKTRSVDAGLGKGLRDQLKAQQGCTLPPDLGGATPRRGAPLTGRKKHRAPAVPPHASLPETPVFSRGCDIPRAPYRALGIPVLRSSLSEEGAALCGPGRGWYPKQRRPAARSTEHLEQAGWGPEAGGGGRKPHTLPPNMSPPKFFHRSSPREALRRVTSLLIRGRTMPAAAPPKPKERPRETAASAAACETPQRQKRSFFRHFWKKSKHYSLEQ